jgi:hypothetical protein
LLEDGLLLLIGAEGVTKVGSNKKVSKSERQSRYQKVNVKVGIKT